MLHASSLLSSLETLQGNSRHPPDLDAATRVMIMEV
jgi:hypothetical protein